MQFERERAIEEILKGDNLDIPLSKKFALIYDLSSQTNFPNLTTTVEMQKT